MFTNGVVRHREFDMKPEDQTVWIRIDKWGLVHMHCTEDEALDLMRRTDRLYKCRLTGWETEWETLS